MYHYFFSIQLKAVFRNFCIDLKFFDCKERNEGKKKKKKKD